MLPEAFALSLLDLMDARLEQAYRLIDSAPSEDAFIPYIPSLERQLFRGTGATAPKANGGPQEAEGGKAAWLQPEVSVPPTWRNV